MSQERLEVAAKALFIAAEELNKVSDELSRVVNALNESFKRLNLGIGAWVVVSEKLDLGYDRVGSRWGVVIQRGDDGERWHFADAPRRYRIDVVDHLPRLIERMQQTAEEESRKIEAVLKRVKTNYGE